MFIITNKTHYISNEQLSNYFKHHKHYLIKDHLLTQTLEQVREKTQSFRSILQAQTQIVAEHFL